MSSCSAPRYRHVDVAFSKWGHEAVAREPPLQGFAVPTEFCGGTLADVVLFCAIQQINSYCADLFVCECWQADTMWVGRHVMQYVTLIPLQRSVVEAMGKWLGFWLCRSCSSKCWWLRRRLQICGGSANFVWGDLDNLDKGQILQGFKHHAPRLQGNTALQRFLAFERVKVALHQKKASSQYFAAKFDQQTSGWHLQGRIWGYDQAEQPMFLQTLMQHTWHCNTLRNYLDSRHRFRQLGWLNTWICWMVIVCNHLLRFTVLMILFNGVESKNHSQTMAPFCGRNPMGSCDSHPLIVMFAPFQNCSWTIVARSNNGNYDSSNLQH